MTTPNIPPPREPLLQGLPNPLSRTWWRFFSQSASGSDSAIVIAENALTIANTAETAAANAQAIAVAAQASANAAQATANDAEKISTEAILRPIPIIPDTTQAVFRSLMISGNYP